MESVTLHGIKSLMCVPLINRGDTLGALYVDHTMVRDLFTRYDDQFLLTVGNLLAAVIDKRRYIDTLENQNINLKKLLDKGFAYENIVASSEGMRVVLKMIEKYAPLKQNVLIVGEKGTGKGLVARALHLESSRRSGPFVKIDSSLIPHGLVEDTLFGHVRGAFSGAYSAVPGLIESADGGTLFLDNCESVPLDVQSSLIHPLESGSVRRLGSTEERRADFRVVSSTEVPLDELVRNGRFRFDLSVILSVLQIHIPPLRERGTDVHLLASHLLKKFAAEAGKHIRGFSNEALDRISAHSWKGNVTELARRIERGVALADGEVLTSRELGLGASGPEPAGTLESSRLSADLSRLTSALLECRGNVTRTANLLGISRRHVQRLLKKYGITAATYRPAAVKPSTQRGTPEEGQSS